MRAKGFTYVAILIAVMIMGVLLAATGQVWSVHSRREKEKELLFVGNQFRLAIGTYYKRPQSAFPQTLEELLQDNREAYKLHHLRKIYIDPMTGTRDWGLIKDNQGRITGVYSKSTLVPIKRTNFTPEELGFENAESYTAWRFIYRPLATTQNTSNTQESGGNPAIGNSSSTSPLSNTPQGSTPTTQPLGSSSSSTPTTQPLGSSSKK